MDEKKPLLPVVSPEKETQDEMIKMKVRTFIAMLISVVVGTNSFSIIYQKIQRNEEQQVYNKERADRVTKRALEDSKTFVKITNLERDLKNCKNSK